MLGLTVKYCFCADEFIIVLMNSFGLNLKLLIRLVTKGTNFFSSRIVALMIDLVEGYFNQQNISQCSL